MILVLDPAGTPVNTAVDSFSGITGVNADTDKAYVLRNNIIESLGANTVIPSTAKISIRAKHTPVEIGSQLTNLNYTEHTFTLTSSLQGSDDNVFGGFSANTWSAVVTFSEAGNHTIDIHTALPSSGIVEYRLNGGTATTAVAASNSTGTITGVTANDTVELRFTQAPTSDQFFDITAPSTTAGYGVLLS